MLTNEQICHFYNAGYLAISEPLLKAEEIARLRAIYDEMFEAQAGREQGNHFDPAGADEDEAPAKLSQILQPQRYRPDILGDYVDLIAEIGCQLLGPKARTEIFHAILKPAGHGAPTPWHQDEAYWDPTRQYRSISFWLPLQDATVENGCMWFMDRSHEWEVLAHQSIGGDPRVHGLELVDPGVITSPVAAPLSATGLTIHSNRTAHYTGPNTTTAPLRALILGVTLEDLPYPTQRRFPWNDRKQTRRDERQCAAAAGGSNR